MAGQGQVRKGDLDMHMVAHMAGYQSVSSAYNHLKMARELNWIGSDGEWYFIRGFERLREDYEAPSRTASELRQVDLSKLDEFLLGAKVKSVRDRKRFLLKTGSKVPKTTAEPYANLNAPEVYRPEYVSCSLIGEWFGISAPTASRLKQRAKRSGYVNYQHRLNKLGVPVKDIDAVKASVAPESRLTTYEQNGKIYVAIRLTDKFVFGPREHIYRFKTRPKT